MANYNSDPNSAHHSDSVQKLKRSLFVCVGIFIMCAATAWAMTVAQFTNTAALTQGVITKLNAGGSHPQVRFTTQRGEVVEYAQNGFIFGYQAGDEVRVLYRPEHPQSATINTFGAIWGFPILMLMMGISFIGVALLQKHSRN